MTTLRFCSLLEARKVTELELLRLLELQLMVPTRMKQFQPIVQLPQRRSKKQ